MAAVQLTLTLERELVDDALESLVVLQRRLAGRHAADMRALRRRIDDFAEEETSEDAFDLTELEPLRFVAHPAGELAAILSEGRRLGLIS